MKIVISALHFDWRDIADCLAKATGDLGLDGVELSWNESFGRPHCTAADIDALAALRGRHRALLSAHIWNNIAESEPAKAAKDLLQWLQVCERTGTNNLVVHGGSYSGRDEGIARTRRVLEGVLAEFERKRVVLNLENHYAYQYRNCHELFSTAAEFTRVLWLDSQSLKFCFDTGHGNMTGTTAELLSDLAPWLNYVHLADNMGIDDDHLAFRQGTVEWDDVFAQMLNISYNGVFCVEFPVRADRDPFHACVREIRDRWHKTGIGAG